MGRNARYTDKFRAEAIVLLEAAGYPDKKGSLMSVSKQLKVPYATISRWFNVKSNPPPLDIVHEKKEQLTDQLENLAEKLVLAMGGKIDDATLQQTATTLGIVVDKWQLLGNKPTAILKLEQAVRDGKITSEQIKDRYPSIADQYFANVDR